MWVESFYVDPSGPWDIDQGGQVATVMETLNNPGPMPMVVTLGNYGPVNKPYTHVQVSVKAGASVASADLVQVRDVLGEEPVVAYVSSWKAATSSGYVDYVIVVSAGDRRRLPGEICAYNGCTYALWFLTSEGDAYPINQARQFAGNLNSDVLSGTMGTWGTDRLFVRLTSLVDGRTEDSALMAPPPVSSDVVKRNVDVTAVARALTAAGLVELEACTPLQALRTPADGSASAGYTACVDGYMAGGASRAAHAVVDTAGAAGAGLLLHAAYQATDDQAQPQPRVPRPAPVPNPADPPGHPVPYLGDPYWSVIDRIETRLREDADPQYAPDSDSEWSIAAEQCYAQAADKWNGVTGHPCETEKIFLPGIDVFAAAKHDAEAIASNPSWVRLTRNQNPTWSDRWYRYYPECAGVSLGLTACDEYPYGKSLEGGPGASLKVINHGQNSMEGVRLSQFFANSRCNVRDGEDFLVTPTVLPASDETNSAAPPTFWVCP